MNIQFGPSQVHLLLAGLVLLIFAVTGLLWFLHRRRVRTAVRARAESRPFDFDLDLPDNLPPLAESESSSPPPQKPRTHH